MKVRERTFATLLGPGSREVLWDGLFLPRYEAAPGPTLVQGEGNRKERRGSTGSGLDMRGGRIAALQMAILDTLVLTVVKAW